jgi:hypothetical protein
MPQRWSATRRLETRKPGRSGLQSADACRSSPPSRPRLAGPAGHHGPGGRADRIAPAAACGRRGVGAPPSSTRGDGLGRGAGGAACTGARTRAGALRSVSPGRTRLHFRSGATGTPCIRRVRAPGACRHRPGRPAAAVRLVAGELSRAPTLGLTSSIAPARPLKRPRRPSSFAWTLASLIATPASDPSAATSLRAGATSIAKIEENP